MKSSGFSRHQSGASLIEILVAVLILSIGLLAMGAMMSYATLLPKFSGNRSVAISTATNMVERMRANPSMASPTFSINSYATSTFSATLPLTTSLPSGSTCTFPNCTQSAMATMDIAVVQQQLNQQIPPAGMTIEVTDASNNEGNLWVVWQEPSTFGSFNTAGSDNCPVAIVTLSLTPPPRCVYLPFKL
jgi:type IV pilus assembly protein PilV